MKLTLNVDGQEQICTVGHVGESLLTTLRDGLHLTETKNACEQGECGSCTVLLDGQSVCACLVASVQCEGVEIRTVTSAVPDSLREAFVQCGAVQCGFCTPGLLVSAAKLLSDNPNPQDAEIRESLAGNLCRCTGYEKIIDAVHSAAAHGFSSASSKNTSFDGAVADSASTGDGESL